MQKNSYLEIANIVQSFKGNFSFISEYEKGEYEIFNSLVNQKKNNNKEVKVKSFIEDKEYEFSYSNYGYSAEGAFLAFIYDKKYLIVFDKVLNSVKHLIKLPDKLLSQINDFITYEKRGFFQRIFSRLSFDEVLYKANNLFIADSGNECLIAASKFIYIFIII